MLVLRAGLATPLGAVAVGPAIAGVALLGPALCANAFHRPAWVGPIAVVVLIAGCLIAALGIAGHLVLWIAFLAALIGTVRALRQPAAASGESYAAWLLLLLFAAALSVLLVAGSKYVNFIADQLLLYGRTDGDVMFHGAIVNAIRDFGMPSTGIDGVHLLRYHTGFDVLAALIGRGSGIEAVFALTILRTTILFPAAVFAVAWAGRIYGRLLLPDLALRPLSLAAGAVIFGLLVQNGTVGYLTLHNDPMALSGVLMTLLAPAVITDLFERRGAARMALIVGAVAMPLICLTKISTGAVWCALVGYAVLRLVGPRRAAFWLTGIVMVLLFAGAAWLATEPAQSGAILFGTPFFVQYGIKDGNYLLPLLIHASMIVVIVALVWLRPVLAAAPRSWIIELLLVTTAAANVPPLILEIDGGDAGFFLDALNWLAAPFIAMLIAAAPHWIRAAAPRRRRLAQAALAIVLLAMVVDGALRSDDRFNLAISGTALVHTGDLSYYADDKRRRVLRADAERALQEHGLIGLFRLPPPPPVGAGLAETLAAARRSDLEQGNLGTSAYIPPQSDYWTFVKDCDGRSLWPMATAGVPLIDGYVPVQAECRQEFALIGYGPAPEVRAKLSEPELCSRATAAGFPLVLQIESLGDRSKDRLLTCR
jgi:hypothetical protein